MSNSFTFLGTGSGHPQAGRATSGGCIKSGESLTILDVGGGVTRSFLKNNFDPTKVDRIIISHTHSDHVCELTLLLQRLHLSKREERVELFLPEEFVDTFEKYLPAVYLFKEKLPFELKVKGYNGNLKLDCGFKLEAFANNHLTPYGEVIAEFGYSNRMQSHSFQITTEKKRMFHTADIASFDDIKDLIDSNDYLIFDSTHVDLPELFDALPEKSIGRVIATHLGTEAELGAMKRAAQKAGITNFELASDGKVLEL